MIVFIHWYSISLLFCFLSILKQDLVKQNPSVHSFLSIHHDDSERCKDIFWDGLRRSVRIHVGIGDIAVLKNHFWNINLVEFSKIKTSERIILIWLINKVYLSTLWVGVQEVASPILFLFHLSSIQPWSWRYDWQIVRKYLHVKAVLPKLN